MTQTSAITVEIDLARPSHAVLVQGHIEDHERIMEKASPLG
jgi:hypothetical protein